MIIQVLVNSWQWQINQIFRIHKQIEDIEENYCLLILIIQKQN